LYNQPRAAAALGTNSSQRSASARFQPLLTDCSPSDFLLLDFRPRGTLVYCAFIIPRKLARLVVELLARRARGRAVKIAISRKGGSEGTPPPATFLALRKSGVSSPRFMRRYFRAFEGLERRDAESLISQPPTPLADSSLIFSVDFVDLARGRGWIKANLSGVTFRRIACETNRRCVEICEYCESSPTRSLVPWKNIEE